MHGLYRKWINPVFTPKAMRELEEKITNYAREYCETMRPRGECEFMGDFAFEFPIKVFLELMGFPIALAPTFLEWEMGLLHTNDLGVIAQSTRKVVDYLRGEIADRQARSEEHTSELQSLMRNSYAVFCLKKKKSNKNDNK